MGFVILCALFLLSLIAVFTWRTILVKYQFLLSKEHFVEFATELSDLKEKQLKAPEGKVENQPEQPPFFVTTAGLALVYSTSPDGEGFWHHVSMSYRGQPLAHAAATTFVAYVARLFAIAPERLKVFRSSTGMYHARFAVTAPEHEALLQRRIPVPESSQVRVIQAECNQVRMLHWPHPKAESDAV